MSRLLLVTIFKNMIWLYIESLGLKSFFTLVEESHNYFICVQFYLTLSKTNHYFYENITGRVTIQ